MQVNIEIPTIRRRVSKHIRSRGDERTFHLTKVCQQHILACESRTRRRSVISFHCLPATRPNTDHHARCSSVGR
jgi:hypothetical protein